MAGLSTTMTAESFRNGTWYLCTDGKLLEPLDVIHLLFANEGRGVIGDRVCFSPKHFKFPPLRNLLPDETEYFLPDDFVDSIVALVILLVLFTLGMIVVKLAWEKFDPQFNSIQPTHKKWYVVANMFKSFFLACMAVSSRYWIGCYTSLVQDDFFGIAVKRTAIVYISIDFVALYMVPKLPTSTIMHHICTTVLILTVSTMNMSIKGWSGLLGVCKMSIVYGVFSSMAFFVNAYLALRVVYPKAKWMPVLVHLSLWPYLMLCAINWSIHAVWVVRMVVTLDISVATVLYLLAVAMMVRDDIVLIKWLWKRNSPMAEKKTD